MVQEGGATDRDRANNATPQAAKSPTLKSNCMNRPVFCGGSNLREDCAMKKSNKFSLQVRARAVRMVQEHRSNHLSMWAAIESIAPKDWLRA